MLNFAGMISAKARSFAECYFPRHRIIVSSLFWQSVISKVLVIDVLQIVLNPLYPKKNARHIH